MSTLLGKVALVTGASKGVGAGIAKELAIRGAAVVVNHARDRTGAEAVVAEIAAIDNGAKLNQVVYWSRPVNSKNQTLTPNPDTILLNPFYDTSNGPVVVGGLTSAPRATLTGRVGSQFFNTSKQTGDDPCDGRDRRLKNSSHMSHMSQVHNPNGSDRFLLSQVSSQVVTGLPSGRERLSSNAPLQV